MGLVRGQAALARMAGLDSLMVIDHLQSPFPEALWRDLSWLRAPGAPHALFDYAAVLGSLAARSGRMRLGVAVTDPVRRHPVVVAQTMLTLAHLTRRPPILGIGSGERENLEPYGLPVERPAGRLEEALQILRDCFAGRLGDFNGDHYTLSGAVMGLRPPPSRVPQIWIGAHGPRMLELTGRFGDGWIPTVVSSAEDYALKWQAVQEAARRAGRSPEAITPSLACYLMLARDSGEARAILQGRMVRYLALMAPASMWRSVGAEHPLGPQFRGFVDVLPEQLGIDEVRRAIQAVPDEVAAIGVMVATPDQLIARVRDLAEAGLQHFSPVVLSGALSRRNAVHDIRWLPSIARRLQGGR
jgi:phthiodiolone/phenolphthiodiolone dimycocerosates ketoreductase